MSLLFIMEADFTDVPSTVNHSSHKGKYWDNPRENPAPIRFNLVIGKVIPSVDVLYNLVFWA